MTIKSIDDFTWNEIKQLANGRCPTCDDRQRYVLESVGYSCDCEYQKLLFRHYIAANIGREYHDICINDFISSDSSVLIPAIHKFIDKYEDNLHYGLGITFNGPFGTGKTFAMACILKELVKQGRSVYMVSFQDLINIWGSSWHDEGSKRKLQDRLMAAETLGIDEVRTDERNSGGFLAAGLDVVLRYRTSNLRPTLVTTNMTNAEEEKEFARTYSLLSARNTRVETSGEDIRGTEIRRLVRRLRDLGERRPVC